MLFPLELAPVAIVQRSAVVLSCRPHRLAATVPTTFPALLPDQGGDSCDTSAVFFFQNLEKVEAERVELAFALHSTLRGCFQRTDSTTGIARIESCVIACLKGLLLLRSDAFFRVEKQILHGESTQLRVHQITQFLYGPVEALSCGSIRQDSFQRGFRSEIFYERF